MLFHDPPFVGAQLTWILEDGVGDVRLADVVHHRGVGDLFCFSVGEAQALGKTAGELLDAVQMGACVRIARLNQCRQHFHRLPVLLLELRALFLEFVCHGQRDDADEGEEDEPDRQLVVVERAGGKVHERRKGEPGRPDGGVDERAERRQGEPADDDVDHEDEPDGGRGADGAHLAEHEEGRAHQDDGVKGQSQDVRHEVALLHEHQPGQ